ncbi:hypothetical protein D3C85_1011490 [compost metagenome]
MVKNRGNIALAKRKSGSGGCLLPPYLAVMEAAGGALPGEGSRDGDPVPASRMTGRGSHSIRGVAGHGDRPQ